MDRPSLHTSGLPQNKVFRTKLEVVQRKGMSSFAWVCSYGTRFGVVPNSTSSASSARSGASRRRHEAPASDGSGIRLQHVHVAIHAGLRYRLNRKDPKAFTSQRALKRILDHSPNLGGAELSYVNKPLVVLLHSRANDPKGVISGLGTWVS